MRRVVGGGSDLALRRSKRRHVVVLCASGVVWCGVRGVEGDEQV